MSENNINENTTDEGLNSKEENVKAPDSSVEENSNVSAQENGEVTDNEEAGTEEESGSRFQEYFNEAVETKNPKMTDTLLAFHELREIDEELTDIEEEKGDLPEKIEQIKSRMENLGNELQGKKSSLSDYTDEKNKATEDNSSYEERINKYDEQKYDVRSNKEYDEIVKTIDSLFEEVKKNEIRLKEITDVSAVLETDIEKLEATTKELNDELSEKQTLLNELDEQYKQEESALRDKRNIILARLDPVSSTLYERINRSYKGEATAIVRKGNCSGCYNSIPPQTVIEIKSAEKIFTCESCGRILISEEMIPTDEV